jgi:general secretion pathway protein G
MSPCSLISAGGRAAPAGRRSAAHAGFTLIEMVVVLAIVAILAMAALPLQEMTLRRAQEQALREGLRSIRTALDEHRRLVEAKRVAPGPDGSPWPASLAVLVQGVVLLDEQGQALADGPRRYLLRKLPRDPFADPALAAADTWAQRASSSPPETPAAGADVFDVSSRAEGQALDGTRLADW